MAHRPKCIFAAGSWGCNKI